MQPIAHIRSDFATKFGIPRQSGLVPELRARIIFQPPYRRAEALAGLEGFSHLWLIWDFSCAHSGRFSPTVRPPRLGGNERMGVFATRSPFRPNSLGLSSVGLVAIEDDRELGPVVVVSGADLADGTPIWDIKPYIVSDCHPDATYGFATRHSDYLLRVEMPPACAAAFDDRKLAALTGVLAQDPRPAYQDDPERVYGLEFAGQEVKFRVAEGVLYVVRVTSADR